MKSGTPGVLQSSAYLVIEVAVSSLRKDRNVKAPLYAASHVDEYWIVNVPERCVEVFRAPADGSYTAVSSHDVSAVLQLQAFPDVNVAVAALFE